MQFSDWLAISALGISLLSFAVAARNTFYDRPRLSVTSRCIEESDYGQARIIVTLVNKGRRPVILRLFGGYDASGRYGGTYLKGTDGGQRLGEHELHEIVVTKNDTVFMGPDEDLEFEVLWVEDSLGIRHEVPKSREYIKRLWTKEPSATEQP